VGRQHVAHFYGSDEELVARVSAFLLEGLQQGSGADGMHRHAFEAGLRASGARLDRRYLAIDVFCGYPLDGVDVQGQLDAVLQVCALHDATCGDHGPIPRREDASSVSVVLPASFSAPVAARRLVVGALRRWGVAAVADDAALVASELATNAVLHARSPFTVGVQRSDDGVRVSVTDAAAGLPVPRAPAPGATSGRGLRMVEALAAAWGTTARADSKTVWAELAVPER